MTSEEIKKYIKNLVKTAPPFVTKEGLPSCLEKAYIDGYNKAINDSCEWLKDYIGYFDISTDKDIATFKKEMIYE